MLSIARIVDEDVVMVKLFGEAAFVAQGACRLEPYVESPSILFGSDLVPVSVLVRMESQSRNKPSYGALSSGGRVMVAFASSI